MPEELYPPLRRDRWRAMQERWNQHERHQEPDGKPIDKGNHDCARQRVDHLPQSRKAVKGGDEQS